MKKAILLFLGLGTLIFASCNKEGNTVDPVKEQDISYSSLSETSNYYGTFKDGAGQTTVNASGQATRISMLKEMDTYIKTGTGAIIDAAKLKNMYENKNNAFSGSDLNLATDKTIVSKTAQSFSATEADAERQRFYGYFNALAAASASNGQTAAVGKAGLLDGKYLVDANGYEYGQFIQKGLIGAMMLDQISNIYLGTEKQSANNTDVVAGQNYTALEHHWDEAYGYLTQNESFPKKDADGKYQESYLGGYVRQVGSPYGDPAAVYMSFLKGRAAIVNNDMTTRDAQIASIRTSLEKAIAVIAVSYLNKTKTATSDGSKFHALSEGYGFVYSLRYAHNPKINKAKSDELLNILKGKENGFWSLTNAEIDNVRDQIGNAFGIDKSTVVNH